MTPDISSTGRVLAWLARWTVAPIASVVLAGCPKQESQTSSGAAAAEAASEGSDPAIGSGQSAPAGQNAAEQEGTGQGAAEPSVWQERAAERRAFIARTVEDRGVDDPAVIEAMRKVPRHRFVPVGSQSMAYTDRPLPIPGGQTISQPYIVAAMTEAAKPTKESTCLEIGTGSGYQAAVLAEVCKETYSIEYLEDVAKFGEQNLRALGYGPERVHLRVGDGYKGWPEAAPFDVIIVTAAPETVPRPLLEQLAVGGHLVIPVGAQHEVQVLERWTRTRKGQGAEAFDREKLMAVRFVPFLGDGVKDQ